MKIPEYTTLGDVTAQKNWIDAISRAKLQWRRSMLRCFVTAVPGAIESLLKGKLKEIENLYNKFWKN